MKNKRWKPKITDKFYYIDMFEYIVVDSYSGVPAIASNLIDAHYRIGNIFRTKKEALAKLRQIKKILKER